MSTKQSRQRRRDKNWQRISRVYAAKRCLGVIDDHLDPLLIWQRDRGICWICRQPIDPSLPSPHPLSRTVDHIHQFGLRGDHVAENVHVAHLRCNLRRLRKHVPVMRPIWNRNGTVRYYYSDIGVYIPTPDDWYVIGPDLIEYGPYATIIDAERAMVQDATR